MRLLVEITDLHFGWPKQSELLNIPSFNLAYRQSMFLKGPSGSGKTTLLGLLSGVQKPTSGSIKLLGQELTTLSAAARDKFRVEHIGYIFQQFNLLPFLSVRENVLIPCRFSQSRAKKAIARFTSPEKAADTLLNHLGLDSSLYTRRADQLSIGQQQRVAAARALIGEPALIIADEPTSALDTDSRENFLKLLFAECDKAGSSLLLVSHDQTLAPLFDRQLSLLEINSTKEVV